MINKIKHEKLKASFIIIIIILIFYHGFFVPGMLPERGGPVNTKFKAGDFVTYNTPLAIAIKNGFTSDGLPFYNRYTFAGEPLLSKPQAAIFSIRTIFIFIFSEYDAVKYSMLFHLYLCGIGFFILLRTWRADFFPALIPAIVILTSGYVSEHFYAGHENIINGIAWLPFVLHFCCKMLNDKSLRAMALTSLFLALMIHEGVDIIFLYTLMIISIFTAGHMLRNLNKRTIVFSTALLLSCPLFAVLLSAAKLLPTLAFVKYSNRKDGLPLEESILRLNETSFPGIGIPVFILMLIFIIMLIIYLEEKDYKKSPISFPVYEIAVLFILGLLIGYGTYFYVLLWKFFPGFKLQRLPERAFILAIISASVFAAYGYQFFISRISLKKNICIHLLIFVILLSERMLFSTPPPPLMNLKNTVFSNEPFLYLHEWKKNNAGNPFRIHIAENTGIDWGVENITIPLGLENIYGYDNLWHEYYMPGIYSRPDEIPYLYAAGDDPVKFYSILNVRFITALQKIEHPQLKLLKDFSENKIPETFLDLPKSYPKYIYENTTCLPRAMFIKHGIIFTGEKSKAISLIYKLMLQGAFNPATALLLYQEKLSEADIKSAERIVFVDSNIDPVTEELFKKYHPDIALGIRSINNTSDFNKAWKEILTLFSEWGKEKVNLDFNDSFTTETIAGTRVKEIRYNSKSMSITMNLNYSQQKGFLFISEKYSLFPGWNAYIFDKKNNLIPLNMQRCSGVLTCISINEILNNSDNPNEVCIVFRYFPEKFKSGLIINLFALLLLFYILRICKYKKSEY